MYNYSVNIDFSLKKKWYTRVPTKGLKLFWG